MVWLFTIYCWSVYVTVTQAIWPSTSTAKEDTCRSSSLSCSQKHTVLGLNSSPSDLPTSQPVITQGWTARITQAKLRSVHVAAIQSLQTIAMLLHTSVSQIKHLGITFANLSITKINSRIFFPLFLQFLRCELRWDHSQVSPSILHCPPSCTNKTLQWLNHTSSQLKLNWTWAKLV